MIQYNEKDKLADGFAMGHTIKEGDIIDLAREGKKLEELKIDEITAKWLGIDLSTWKYVPNDEDRAFYEEYKEMYRKGRELHGDNFVLVTWLDERS